MIRYCYGPDSYRRGAYTKELLAEARNKTPAADFFTVDFSETPDGWRAAREFLNQPSMFSGDKIMLVRESGEVEEKGEKEWVKCLKAHLEDVHAHIIISDSWEKPRKAFGFLLEKPAKAFAFEALSGKVLETFLKEQAKETGVALEAGAWEYFLKFIGSDAEAVWRGVRELEKLSLSGFKGAVTEEQLRETMQWTARTDAFSAARKLLARGDTKKKIMILEWLLGQGEEPAKLFNLVAYVASGEDAVRLADLDVAIKSGNAEYEEALLDFVLA